MPLLILPKKGLSGAKSPLRQKKNKTKKQDAVIVLFSLIKIDSSKSLVNVQNMSCIYCDYRVCGDSRPECLMLLAVWEETGGNAVAHCLQTALC